MADAEWIAANTWAPPCRLYVWCVVVFSPFSFGPFRHFAPLFIVCFRQCLSVCVCASIAFRRLAFHLSIYASTHLYASIFIVVLAARIGHIVLVCFFLFSCCLSCLRLHSRQLTFAERKRKRRRGKIIYIVPYIYIYICIYMHKGRVKRERSERESEASWKRNTSYVWFILYLWLVIVGHNKESR